MARVPHGYHDTGAIREQLTAAGFANIAIDAVEHRSRAPSPRHPAVGYCQGTPWRSEIEARDASVEVARSWVLSRGGDSSAVRVASITVTSDRARAEVDFHVHDGLCRFPWSPDSSEHQRYVELRDAITAPGYTGSATVAGGR